VESEEKACNLCFINSVFCVKAKMILERTRFYGVDIKDGRCTNATFIAGAITIYWKFGVMAVNS